MQNKKIYEWDLEACDGNEVLEHDFREAEGVPALRKHLDGWTPATLEAANDKTMCLVLVQHTGNQDDGEVDRGHAYVEHTSAGPALPERFDNGERVPKRFSQQLEKWAANCE